MESFVENIFEEMKETLNKFTAKNKNLLIAIAQEIADCFMEEGKLLIFGNGGSAADAQHIAAEFINRFKIERPSLPAIALTTDTSVLTSISNDYDFNQVFLKQVMALADERDIVWGISTSGNSENVINALRFAATNDIKTIGFTGKDGGKMNGLCDLLLVVDSDNTARIQEMHIAAAHIICELVDEIMFGRFSDMLEDE
ncbi:phosphoheptose isomerase [Deferribacter desulfuricans SSM1]|uniref:Phosphoheptose isomerase n=1 Tax=Deferribacter desulfuricans (strain DSM 14783 / JCM 11476 / NBRC 101012 / SSM1) TaxID=639282 RepID=D3PAW5_DEFDS|nr:D-sedoheptulose 7-phosphate isomerase [Deferribacter desulfuricans]BAI79738.1 phosphoheptose isomerase [Deferribacter desulfuricans SSM1]